MSTGFPSPIRIRTACARGVPGGTVAAASPLRDTQAFAGETTPGAVAYAPVFPAQPRRANAILALGGMVTDAREESNVPGSESTSDQRRKKSSPDPARLRSAVPAHSSGVFPPLMGA